MKKKLVALLTMVTTMMLSLNMVFADDPKPTSAIEDLLESAKKPSNGGFFKPLLDFFNGGTQDIAALISALAFFGSLIILLGIVGKVLWARSGQGMETAKQDLPKLALVILLGTMGISAIIYVWRLAEAQGQKGFDSELTMETDVNNTSAFDCVEF